MYANAGVASNPVHALLAHHPSSLHSSISSLCLSNILEYVSTKYSKATLITWVFSQLYKSELENEFSEFMDWLHTFPIYKGKANEEEDDDEEERSMGKYKVSEIRTNCYSRPKREMCLPQ